MATEGSGNRTPGGGAPDGSLVEARVRASLEAFGITYEAIRIDPAHADTATFCAVYGYAAEESANCLVAASKTGERRFAAFLVQATRRLDLNRHARPLLGARKASFASADETVAVTGMLPGGVTPVGLPTGVPLFVDEPVLALPSVIVGGGGRSLKLRLAPRDLLLLPDVTVVAELSRPAA